MSSYYDSRTQSVLLYPTQLARSAFVPHRRGRILKVGRFPRRANAPQELQIDGRLLRTGAANFSPSGWKHQDNDLIVKAPRRQRHRTSTAKTNPAIAMGAAENLSSKRTLNSSIASSKRSNPSCRMSAAIAMLGSVPTM